MRIKSFKFNGIVFDIRRVMRAMVRTYQITMGRAYYKCTLVFSSTSNVTDTFFSRSIVKSNLELCSCARPIAHHAPPSPPPLPTTVLLQQLQALYDVLFLFNSCCRHLDLTSRRLYVTNFEPYLRPFQNN